MRVPFGRRTAVPVALLATVVLVAALGAAPTFAASPPGLARFMYAMGQVESGGNYTARNATSGAYGKYQIMPSSWRAWAGRYLDDPDARPTPANQEIVAAGKMTSLYRGLDSWRRVAYWWLTGSSQSSGWSDYATGYVNRVMRIYNNTSNAELATTTSTALRRISEKSASIAWSGSWKSASHPGYAGGAARYSTDAGATATFAFSGNRIVWYGPVGPTRGKARVFVDGALVRTVDLYQRAFDARKAVFSKGWASTGRHTLVIEVVGTAGRPYVAIDQLAVGG